MKLVLERLPRTLLLALSSHVVSLIIAIPFGIAGFASGLTGEGMYFAMVSGIEIAKKIIDPKYDQPKLKEVIILKKKHEEILSLIKKNKILSQVEYDILGLAQKSKLLDNLLIEKFC